MSVFAVGSKGTILHFAGSAWRLEHTGNEGFRGAFGVSSSDVFDRVSLITRRA